MARLCSVSCGPLPVFLLLLLASVPAMAAFSESGLEALVEHFHEWAEKFPQSVREHFPGLFEKVTPHDVRERLVGWAEKLTPRALRKMNVREDFIKGVKGGFKTCKKLKKISRLVHKQNPDMTPYAVAIIPTGGTADMRLPVFTVDITATDHAGLCGLNVTAGLGQPAPSWAVVGFGNGGGLSQTFSKFSYRVRPDGTAAVWLPTTPPLQGRHLGESSQLEATTTTIPLYTNPTNPRDGRYYVEVTGIRVGEEVVETPTQLGFWPDGTGGVYLSTTEPYTYLERLVYVRLKLVLMLQIKKLNPEAVAVHTQSSAPQDPAAGKLCYTMRAELRVPSMAIVFAGNAVMKLGKENVWYREGPSTVCLAILPTYLRSPGQASVIGSWMQSGRTMTIDVARGTLTF